MISLVAAVDQSRTIGHQGKIPWSIPSDLRHFQRTTKGHVVIMGRLTAESILATKNSMLPPDVVLPGRVNIVVSNNEQFRKLVGRDVQCAVNLEKAIEIAEHWIGDDGTKQIFIIGGARVYKEALDAGIVDRMIISDVDCEVDGDTKFPKINPTSWAIKSEGQWIQEPGDQYRYRVLEFVPSK